MLNWVTFNTVKCSSECIGLWRKLLNYCIYIVYKLTRLKQSSVLQYEFNANYNMECFCRGLNVLPKQWRDCIVFWRKSALGNLINANNARKEEPTWCFSVHSFSHVSLAVKDFTCLSSFSANHSWHKYQWGQWSLSFCDDVSLAFSACFRNRYLAGRKWSNEIWAAIQSGHLAAQCCCVNGVLAA